MLYNFTIPYFVYGTPNNTLQTLHYRYIFTSKIESVAYFCDSYSIIASIGQFRILTVGLDLAWNGGWCGQINLHLKRFARISLHFMLDPVQPWEFENGVLNAPLVCYGSSWWHERPKTKNLVRKNFSKLTRSMMLKKRPNNDLKSDTGNHSCKTLCLFTLWVLFGRTILL